MAAQLTIRPGDKLSFPNAEAVLEATQLLGSGGFGQVWKCKVHLWDVPGVGMCTERVKAFEVDEYKAVKVSAHGAQQEDSLREEAMKLASHSASWSVDAVPHYFFHGAGVAVCDNPTNIYGLCMSCIDGINLGRLISFKRDQAHTVAYRTSCGIMRELFVILRDLHACGIIYGDVKPENIMVGVDGKCTFVDFGISLAMEDFPEGTEMPIQGTLEYMAPEMLSARYDEKVDMWSAGCLGYLLATGRPVWQREPGVSAEAQLQIVLGEFLVMRRTVDYSYIPGGPTGGMYTYYGEAGIYARMLRQCLEARSSRRISSVDIFDGTCFAADCFLTDMECVDQQQRRLREWVLAALADGAAEVP